jgi:glycosyltransferase involved in cell wall biosynthesis
MMTAALSPGDALGNHVLTLRRLLGEMGFRVRLYADWISPQYPAPAYASLLYRSTGHDIFWYQYSIGADNLKCIVQSTDYCIMDFHGVSPPRLFAGYDPHLEELCRQGENMLPQLRDEIDLCVVHSEYSRQVLEEASYRQPIEKLPLVVDPARYDGSQDVSLSAWLPQLEYLMFVGRIVPQKDILAMLRIFAGLRRCRPDAVLVLVGRRDMARGYQRNIARAMKQLGVERRVLFLEHINDTAMLSSLYRHARATIIVSEWESFCVPVVESMHFGTPVVAHAVPPVPEVMGAGGILIDKHDPRSAARAIDAIWDASPRRAQLQAAARERAAHFSEATLRRDLLAMLHRAFRV